MEAFWDVLGVSFGVFGASWKFLGASWERFESALWRFGRVLGRLGAIQKPRRQLAEVGVLTKRALASQGRPHFAQKKEFKSTLGD